MFTVQPVQSQLESIQSGDGKARVSLTCARRGGLVAMQTCACPSLVTDEAFDVASIAKPGAGLPVWQQLEVAFELVGREATEIVKGQHLRLHSGSSCAEAEVLAVDGNSMRVCFLDKPLCARIGSAVAIERKDQRQWTLCASGDVVGGSQCCEGIDQQQQTSVSGGASWQPG